MDEGCISEFAAFTEAGNVESYKFRNTAFTIDLILRYRKYT